MSYHNDEEDETDKDTGMLLNLCQKSSIFVADQTPTPTRLIKNCEEVGLFEDLRNVNPFDETFRRACELNVQHNCNSHQHFHIDENSLHTPQVFPQFDTAVDGGIIAREDLTKQTLNTPIVVDVSNVEEHILDVPPGTFKPKSSELCPTKYRAIAEKPTAIVQHSTGISFLPSTVQFIQPQVITVTFPTISSESTNSTVTNSYTKTIPKSLNKTKPLLLPKLSTNTTTNTKDVLTSSNNLCSSSTFTQSSAHNPEPSSASLTPTSQLPIKERLKAILNQSSKTRPAEWSNKTYTKPFNTKSTTNKSSKDDSMERRRAASTRYRHKIRNEHTDLKIRNMELQTENDKLKHQIKQLEKEVYKLQSTALHPFLADSSSTALGVPAQIQIPASTIHLVMNIPKLVVPCGSSDLNTQTILKNPFSYRIDKT